MERAEEIFTAQLGRAAAKNADRFLRARGLQRADRDDIISAAILWCWINKANYSLTTTLETWFMNAVRDAYKNLKRAELPVAEESLAALATLNRGDETYRSAAALSSAEVLIKALTPVDREIASLSMRGHTRAEMIERGVPEWAIRSGLRRIKQLRRLVPARDVVSELRRTGATPRAPDSDDLDDSQVPGIDREIAQLDFPPTHGKDCPPCWRCCYFEGFMPSGKIDTRMEIADKEVEAAVAATNERKIEIAQQVRNGGLQLCHR
jgi:hypothetical protein